jgi:hypothetical protein
MGIGTISLLARAGWQAVEPFARKSVLLIASRSDLRNWPWKYWWNSQVSSKALGSCIRSFAAFNRCRYSLRLRAALAVP